jgi:hypothetical protein
MLFQETELHDQLACQSPATPRMIELILALMRAREDSLRSGELLQLPRRMLADPLQGFAPVEPRFDLAQLFPGNEVFGESELERVQVELNLARERLGSLPLEMEELRQRTLELNEQNQKLAGRAREQRQRFEKLRAAYLQLRERWQQRRKPSGPGSVSARSELGRKSKEGVNLRIEPDEAAGAPAGQLLELGPSEAVVEASRPIAELDSPLPESAVPASGST